MFRFPCSLIRISPSEELIRALRPLSRNSKAFKCRLTHPSHSIGSKSGKSPLSLGSKYSAHVLASLMSLVWEDHELPPGCTVQALQHSDRDLSLAAGILPIERDAWQIKSAIRGHTVVAIKAETGSGKTMKGPQYLREEVNHWPVLIVQKSCLAAEKVVSSLEEGFHLDRSHLHLRTGIHDAESFQAWTRYSVITYGILWEWLRL